MRRFNRYLLFFSILGVGLVIAWTLAGRRAELGVPSGARVMEIDQPCKPLAAPCAAYAKDFALVAGPAPQGAGLLLVGEKLPDDTRLELAVLDIQSRPLASPSPQPLPGDRRWRVELADGAGRMRVNLHSGNQLWVAKFPLQ